MLFQAWNDEVKKQAQQLMISVDLTFEFFLRASNLFILSVFYEDPYFFTLPNLAKIYSSTATHSVTSHNKHQAIFCWRTGLFD